MGLLDGALGKLREVAERTGQAKPAGAGRDLPPIPDLATLVTQEEIREVTGGSPEGTPRTNGADGMEVDLGRLVIWEARLSNGGEFLITLSACFDEAAANLGMDRMAEVEHKPLDGVGERGLVRVKSYRKQGTSEVGVTAHKGRYNLSLTHTTADGATEYGPLTELLRKALDRL
jgi:hypothetical protein